MVRAKACAGDLVLLQVGAVESAVTSPHPLGLIGSRGVVTAHAPASDTATTSIDSVPTVT